MQNFACCITGKLLHRNHMSLAENNVRYWPMQTCITIVLSNPSKQLQTNWPGTFWHVPLPQTLEERRHSSISEKDKQALFAIILSEMEWANGSFISSITGHKIFSVLMRTLILLRNNNQELRQSYGPKILCLRCTMTNLAINLQVKLTSFVLEQIQFVSHARNLHRWW